MIVTPTLSPTLGRLTRSIAIRTILSPVSSSVHTNPLIFQSRSLHENRSLKISVGRTKEDLTAPGTTTDLQAMDSGHAKQTAWSGPGPAAFDFRSKSFLLLVRARQRMYANTSRRCGNHPHPLHARCDSEYNPSRRCIHGRPYHHIPRVPHGLSH